MIDNYNPNQLQYNAMNPNAMSNMQTLQNVNGVQLDNTFNRVPAPQMNQQYSMPPGPLPPPLNAQTQIMPNNNLQTY
jgi:hypothetical protein